MSRRTRPSIGRRALTGAGLLMSAAGMSASVAAQTQRTGWEDVKPTGWPSSATTATAAPRPTTVATATPAPRPSKSASRSSRRRARPTGSRRPTAPAWITLEWETPPPIDVALDWAPALVNGRSLVFVAGTPAAPAVALERATVVLDATVATDEARLPVATMIHATAATPATPRPAAFSRSRAGDATRTPGFRGLMSRLANAFGIRRAAQPDDVAPRVASGGGAATR
jgi:hypothetical protein